MSGQTKIDWTLEASKLPTDEISPVAVPVAVQLLEAENVAVFVERYWDPAPDGSLPGLVEVEALMPRAIVSYIRELVAAARAEHTRALFPVGLDAESREMVMRGRLVISELRAAAEFVLDDDIDESRDEALAQAKERESEDGSHAALAQGLSDYAGICESVLDGVKKISSFNPALIDEAKALAEKIHTVTSPTPGRPSSPAIDTRNRLLTLLADKLNEVRKATRYVFRFNPEIARLVNSTYQRRKRAEARKKKNGADPVDNTVDETETATTNTTSASTADNT